MFSDGIEVRMLIRAIFVGAVFLVCLWALGVEIHKALVFGAAAYFATVRSFGSRWIERGAFALLVSSMLLWINVTPSPGEIRNGTLTETLIITGNYTLTSDLHWPFAHGTAVRMDGAGTLDLNGHRIIGVGGAGNTSIGVYALNQSNITVRGGVIAGFGTGINILDTVAESTANTSQSNNSIRGMTISDCAINGFLIGGEGSLVKDTTIYRIGIDGTDTARAYGGQFFGGGATFDGGRVYYIFGGNESVGISFSGRHGDGAVLNSTVNGRTAPGQSFGIWSSGKGQVTIYNSHIHDWDYAAGGAGSFSYGWSTFARNVNDFGYAALGAVDADGRNVIIPAVTGSGSIDGTPGDDRLIGGATDDFISGGRGHDHLVGNQGADTFIFNTEPDASDKDVILDFQQLHGDVLAFAWRFFGDANDPVTGLPRLQIGSAAGAEATFFLSNFTLFYDADGAGPGAAIPIVYLPYYSTLKQSDLKWLDKP